MLRMHTRPGEPDRAKQSPRYLGDGFGHTALAFGARENRSRNDGVIFKNQ